MVKNPSPSTCEKGEPGEKRNFDCFEERKKSSLTNCQSSNMTGCTVIKKISVDKIALLADGRDQIGILEMCCAPAGLI